MSPLACFKLSNGKECGESMWFLWTEPGIGSYFIVLNSVMWSNLTARKVAKLWSSSITRLEREWIWWTLSRGLSQLSCLWLTLKNNLSSPGTLTVAFIVRYYWGYFSVWFLASHMWWPMLPWLPWTALFFLSSWCTFFFMEKEFCNLLWLSKFS